MNDFTKEELIALLRSFKGDECVLSVSDMIGLESKLESMIDNYCEHEPEPTEHEICCIKCQRTLL